jgi:hypothetical protein
MGESDEVEVEFAHGGGHRSAVNAVSTFRVVMFAHGYQRDEVLAELARGGPRRAHQHGIRVGPAFQDEHFGRNSSDWGRRMGKLVAFVSLGEHLAKSSAEMGSNEHAAGVEGCRNGVWLLTSAGHRCGKNQ